MLIIFAGFAMFMLGYFVGVVIMLSANKLSEEKEETQPSGKAEFYEPVNPREAFDKSETIDEFLKQLN